MDDDTPDLAALRMLPVSPRPAGYVTTRDGDALDRLVVAWAAGWPDLTAAVATLRDALDAGPVSPAAAAWLDAARAELRDRLKFRFAATQAAMAREADVRLRPQATDTEIDAETARWLDSL